MKKTTYIPAEHNYTDGLRERLAQSGILHSALAAEAEIDPSQLSRWFNTAMQPSLRNVQRLEQAFSNLQRRYERRK